MGVEVLGDDVGGCAELTEEDEVDVLVEFEFDARVLSLESFEFDQEFLDEEGEGELHSKGSLVLDGDLDDVVFLNDFLDDSLHWDLDDLGELDMLVELSEEFQDNFDLPSEVRVALH